MRSTKPTKLRSELIDKNPKGYEKGEHIYALN